MSTGIAKENIEKAKKWLTSDVYPLWLEQGIDKKTGGFVESITFSGEAMDVPRRAMVQSRQIYAFLTGAKLGCCPQDIANAAIEAGANYLIKNFSLPSGAFAYSVNVDGTLKSSNPDLYTQAFALFGLAQAYSVHARPEFKERAKNLLSYLRRERRVRDGGYTEIEEDGKLTYKSNPHMHLFEAAIAWMQIDNDQDWKDLGHELVTLSLNKFIDPTTQVLGEYFDENWNSLKGYGSFIYEPGHQYEWAWLFSLYQDLTGQDLKAVRHSLFSLAEKYGVSPLRQVVFDEMWSNFNPKTESSRFWPQCERIKAAVRLGTEVSKDQQSIYHQAADEALETLFKFFNTPKSGMWYDMLSAEDTFSGTSAKASSLYHIVNAIEEYVNLR